MGLERVVAPAAIGAQLEIGIPAAMDVALHHGLEPGFVAPEDRRDRADEIELGLVDGPVGASHEEQALDDVVQQGRLLREGPPELPGVGLEAGRRLLGQAEQALDVLVVLRRHDDHRLEGVDLRAQHHAIRPRHLGQQGDETGGQDEVAGRRPEGRPFPVDEVMAREGSHEGADRTADGEADAAPAELAPDRHALEQAPKWRPGRGGRDARSCDQRQYTLP